MKKRIFSLALVLCFVLSFAAMASASGMEVYLTIDTARDYEDDFGNPMVGEEYEEKSINFTFCDTAHIPYIHSSNTSTYYIGDVNTSVADIANKETKQLLLTGDSENGLIISVGDPVEFSSGKKKGSYVAVTLKGTPEAKGNYKFRLVRKTGSTSTNTDFTITVKEVV